MSEISFLTSIDKFWKKQSKGSKSGEAIITGRADLITCSKNYIIKNYNFVN